MSKQLLIFGASTLARLAHVYASTGREAVTTVGFAVDRQYLQESEFLGVRVYDWTDARAAFDPADVWVHVAVGYQSMRARAAAFDRVKAAGYRTLNIVSDGAYVAAGVELGENNLVMPGVVAEPGCRLGSNNVVWSNATLCHDVTIGSHNFIAANCTLGGHSVIGDRSFLGFSAVLLPRVKVGSDTLVGAQSLVRADTGDLAVCIGSPARRTGAVDPLGGVTVT